MNLFEKCKPYLDLGTNEGLRYNDTSKSRYVSFKFCLNHLLSIKNPCILELGTCRSFVDGKFEGCNEDNTKYWNPTDFSKWDWGAGCFSLIFGQLANNCDLTSVDLMASHVKRCKLMTSSLNIKCDNVVSDSIEFLKNTNKKFDLIYLDTGDMHPIEPSEDLQLAEAQVIVEKNLLNADGLILIDDVLNGTPREQGNLTNTLGKSTKSIPYLLNNGFKTVYEGYQYILKKE
jgi:hypothetical protein